MLLPHSVKYGSQEHEAERNCLPNKRCAVIRRRLPPQAQEATLKPEKTSRPFEMSERVHLVASLLVMLSYLLASQSTNALVHQLEEEVEIHQQQAPSSTAQPAARRQHIYRITANVNGRIQLPYERFNARSARLGVSSESLPAAANGFGSRSPTLAPKATVEACSNGSSPSMSTTTSAADEQMASSIAASSPMLRLTASNRTSPLQQVAASEKLSLPSKRPKRPLVASAELAPVEELAEREGTIAAVSVPAWPTWSLSSSPQAEQDSILGLVDAFDSAIATNRSEAQLSCDSGEMILRLNFTEPFKGIVYPDHNRVSACRLFGNSQLAYTLRLPLRGCGTRQAAPRVFVNDVIVRFHKTLELEEDEVKTLICRYPPPLTSTSSSASPNEQAGEHSILSRPDTTTSSFELIEPSLDTQSDNLALLASNFARNSHTATNGRPSNANPDRPIQSGSPFQHRQQNLILPNGGANVAESQDEPQAPLKRDQIAPQAGYFERLSSLELLFMISSLMFLVLLAFGLATSYLCLRRHSRRRRAVDRRASAILRRNKHHYGLASSASHHQQTTAGAPLKHPLAAHLRPQAGPTPQPQYAIGPGYLLPSSSSPESELSHTNLLSQPATANSQAYFYANRAFVPDLLADHNKQTYMAPLTLGRRDYSAPYPTIQHYQSSPARRVAHLMPARATARVPPPPPPPVVKRPLHQHHRNHQRQHQHHQHQHHINQAQYQQASNLDGTQSLWRNRTTSQSQAPHLLSASLARREAPKIYLKSIEDSYISKFTEIHEQEYLKRDSTRPLGMAEWRKFGLKQPQCRQTNRTRRASSSSSGSGSNSSSDTERQHRLAAASHQRADLRSLTELDVNFARSLVGRASSQLRSARSLDRLAEPQRSVSRMRTYSGPELVVNTLRAVSSSPDLILSPEYEHEPPALRLGSRSSHNTVSYV